MTTPLHELLEKWEDRGRSAHPSDAMLINKHARELREALTTPPPASDDARVGGETVPTLQAMFQVCANERRMQEADALAVAIAALAAAQPADGGEKQFLSDAEIEAGWRETFSIDNPFCPCDLGPFRKAVRWTERKSRHAALNAPGAAKGGGE